MSKTCTVLTSPIIGVITVNLNNAIGLEETIKSFASQRYESKKLFIVDGNSTDASSNVVNKYRNLISDFICEADEGIYDAMNKGFLLSAPHVDYVIFLNTSDLFYSDNVLTDISALISSSHTMPDIVAGKALYLMKDNCSRARDIFLTHKLSYVHIGSPFCHQACFFLAASLPNPPYDKTFKIAGDYALFCQLYKARSTVLYTDTLVSLFDPSGLSSNPRFGHITRQETFHIRKYILKQPLIFNSLVGLYIFIVGIMREHFRLPYVALKKLFQCLFSSRNV